MTAKRLPHSLCSSPSPVRSAVAGQEAQSYASYLPAVTGLECLALLLALLSLMPLQHDYAAVAGSWSAGWVSAGWAAETLS